MSTTRGWLYKDGKFESIELQWPEKDVDLDELLKLSGLTNFGRVGSGGNTLRFDLYSRVRSNGSEPDESPDYAIVVEKVFDYEIVFCPDLPNFLEWMRLYSPMISTIIVGDKEAEAYEKEREEIRKKAQRR